MRSKSTELMHNIVDYIDLRFAQDNKVPTMQDIADHFGVTKGSISQYIQVMVDRGLIEKENGARGLVTPNMKKLHKEMLSVPIIGAIACGTPVLSEENIETVVTLPRELTGTGNFYLLRAYGDSMIDAGIEDGDLVLVHNTHQAQDGQIVVALVENETTLKRFHFDEANKKVILHPENKTMQDMIFDEVSIQGVAVNVIKKL